MKAQRSINQLRLLFVAHKNREELRTILLGGAGKSWFECIVGWPCMAVILISFLVLSPHHLCMKRSASEAMTGILGSKKKIQRQIHEALSDRPVDTTI